MGDDGETAVRELSHQEPTGADGEHRFELCVSGDLPCFDGHFPGDPVMPAAAQLDLLVLPRVSRVFPGLGRLRGVRALRFRRPVRPGEPLILRLRRAPGQEHEVRFQLDDADGRCAAGTLLLGDGGPP